MYVTWIVPNCSHNFYNTSILYIFPIEAIHNRFVLSLTKLLRNDLRWKEKQTTN